LVQLAASPVTDALQSPERKTDLWEEIEQMWILTDLHDDIPEESLRFAGISRRDHGKWMSASTDRPDHRPDNDCTFASASRHPDRTKTPGCDDLLQLGDQCQMVIGPPQPERCRKACLQKRLEIILASDAQLLIDDSRDAPQIATGLG